MVRYSTGRALVGAVSTVSSWFSDPDAEEYTPKKKVTVECTPKKKVSEVTPAVTSWLDDAVAPLQRGHSNEAPEATPEPQVVLKAVHTGAPAQPLVKPLDEHNQVLITEGTTDRVVEDLRKSVVRRDALALWLNCSASDTTCVQAAFCAWRRVLVEDRTLRAMVRSQQRVAYSPEVWQPVPPVPPSPALSNALGAFLLDTEEPLVGACFCAWRKACEQAKGQRATMMWLLERMALSQKGLLRQAVFRSWCHAAQHANQPAWALNLRRDVQTLLRDQATEQDGGVSPLSSPQLTRIRGPWAILLLLMALSLLWNVSMAFRAFTGVTDDARWRIDSDGDGIEDRADRCPQTPASYKFRSTWQTDWDGDGCLDSVEDMDDDNDLVLDHEDLCPRTLIVDGQVDSEGCAPRQRQLLSEESSGLDRFYGKLRDIVLEVFIGMILTAGVNALWRSDEGSSKLWRICQHVQAKMLECIRSAGS
jgi:hypothetical protein